jgi:hypothetical protein
MTELIRKLTDSDLQALQEDCYPKLVQLNELYTPEIDLKNGIIIQTEYLDLLRASWLNDMSESRPPYEIVVEGVGFVFGLMLKNAAGYTWSLCRFQGVEFISMVKYGAEGEMISVPPFSYVQKRENTQNVEVFSDFFDPAKNKYAKA